MRKPSRNREYNVPGLGPCFLGSSDQYLVYYQICPEAPFTLVRRADINGANYALTQAKARGYEPRVYSKRLQDEMMVKPCANGYMAAYHTMYRITGRGPNE